jgi:hypothetical protein
MTGQEFAIRLQDAPSGIFLHLSSSARAPQDAVRSLKGNGTAAFFIRGDETRLEIVANDESGLANGVYFYLESLGVRWLLPGDNWTVVPKRDDVALKIDRLVGPAFAGRDFSGSGGFFSWRWGRRYGGSFITENLMTQWQRRLRYGEEFGLGKAVGEAFVSDKRITPILERHPEYLAKIDGKHTPLYVEEKDGTRVLNDIAKLNAGEPGAVALFCDWAIRNFRIWHDGRVPPGAAISVEPSDGLGYGDNVSELPGDGSGSDQTFFVANQCAKRVRAEYSDTNVVLLAYGGHARPPSFPLERNVIVQLVPYAFQETEPEAFIAQWKRKASKLALYDYWSIPDWTHDEPTFDYLNIGGRLRHWHANEIRGVNAETTYGAGAMGLGHYVAAHLMWDLGLDERALLEDWYQKAFGPAKAPMKCMLERWAHSFRLTSAEMGASFHDIAEAARLGESDPEVAARIDDYALYLHYLRLRLEVRNAPDQARKSEAMMMLVRHLLSINDSAMVHTTRIIDTDSKAYPDVVAAFDLANPNAPGPGWASVIPLSHRDIQVLIVDGVEHYPRADWSVRTYSGPLAALQPDLPSTPVDESWGPVMPTIGDLDVFLDVRRGLTKIPLRVTREVDNEISVFDAKGRAVVATTILRAESKDASTWEELAVSAPPGLYRIHFHPAGGRSSGYFSFQTRKGVPMVMQSFLAPKRDPSPKLYFYVPHGLRTLVMFLPHGDWNGVFHFQILDADGTPSSIEYRDERRTLEIAVPAGQDGRIWSLNHMVSPDFPHEMLNAPQAFSLSPETLMVPSDAP